MRVRKTNDAMKRERKRLIMDPLVKWFNDYEIGKSIRWHAMRESIMTGELRVPGDEVPDYVSVGYTVDEFNKQYGESIPQRIATAVGIPSSRLFGYDEALPGSEKTVVCDWSTASGDVIIDEIKAVIDHQRNN